MRRCPHCNEKSISNIKLFFQETGIPAVVASCPNCYAIVTIEDKESIFGAIALEWILFLVLIASLIHFFSIWPGILLFVSWRLIRKIIKIKQPLKYIR